MVVTFQKFIHSSLPFVASLRVSFVHPPLYVSLCNPYLYVYPGFLHVVISLVLKAYVQVQKSVVGISIRFRPLSVLKFFLVFTLFACKLAALYFYYRGYPFVESEFQHIV